MSTIKHGGPAFPLSRESSIGKNYEGMSLRDYFAAQAMQAFLSGHITHHGHELHWPYNHMASSAFEVADAMLAARGAQ